LSSLSSQPLPCEVSEAPMLRLLGCFVSIPSPFFKNPPPAFRPFSDRPHRSCFDRDQTKSPCSSFMVWSLLTFSEFLILASELVETHFTFTPTSPLPEQAKISDFWTPRSYPLSPPSTGCNCTLIEAWCSLPPREFGHQLSIPLKLEPVGHAIRRPFFFFGPP